jgi:inosose dehydratase
MAGFGFKATELGAPGFLPSDPTELKTLLSKYGMSLIGGFTPLVLHNASEREASIESAIATATLFQAAGATMFVSSIVQDMDWSFPEKLTAEEQKHMAEMFGVIDDICADHGLTQVLHPHVQTLVETKDDINRVLDTCDVKFCLDTGHIALGGMDPVKFAKESFDRVGHVHLKDVNLAMGPAVLRREISLMKATQAGLFTPLGQGSVDILGVVEALEAQGYQGWYVIEQDTAITDGMPAIGEGPLLQVTESMKYLLDVVAPKVAAGAK